MATTQLRRGSSIIFFFFFSSSDLRMFLALACLFFSLATMYSGSLLWVQLPIRSFCRFTSWIPSLIWVSTRDFAPWSGMPVILTRKLGWDGITKDRDQVSLWRWMGQKKKGWYGVSRGKGGLPHGHSFGSLTARCRIARERGEKEGEERSEGAPPRQKKKKERWL